MVLVTLDTFWLALCQPTCFHSQLAATLESLEPAIRLELEPTVLEYCGCCYCAGEAES